MKNYRLLFAAFAAGSLLAACNNKIDEEVIPAPRSEYVISVDAVKNIDTKVLTPASDGKSLEATWGADDAVAVCRIVDGTLSEVVGKLAPTTTGEATTKLEGSVTLDGVSEGDWLFLQFPYKTVAGDDGKLWLDCSYAGQDGQLETVAKSYDYATCGVQVSAIDGENISVSKATFYNRQAIVKFSINNSGKTIFSNRLVLDAQVADRFWHDEYYTEPLFSVSAGLEVNDEYTLALHDCAAGYQQRYKFFALNREQVYTAISPAFTFEDGKYYQGTVAMAPMSYASYTEDSSWGLIGELSEYDVRWDKDLNMWTDGNGNHVAASVKLKSTDTFKFRNYGSWDENVGATTLTDSYFYYVSDCPDLFTVVQNGQNINVPYDGVYDIYFNSYKNYLIITPASNGGKESLPPVTPPEPPADPVWSVIGGFNGWDGDIDMTEQSDGSWVSPAISISGEFKIRFAHSWDVNRGAEGEGLNYSPVMGREFTVVQGGLNVNVPEGNYIVTYIPDPDAEDKGTMIVKSVGDIVSIAGAPKAVFGSYWDASDVANEMTLQEDGTYVKTYQVSEATDIAFKIVREHGWESCVPEDVNYTKTVGAGTLTIYFNPANNDITVVAPDPPASSYTIAGDADPYSEPSDYVLGTQWDPANTANDMVLQSDGKYKKWYFNFPSEKKIYFKVVTGHSWENICYGSDRAEGLFEEGTDNCCYVKQTTAAMVITFDPSGDGWITVTEEE